MGYKPHPEVSKIFTGNLQGVSIGTGNGCDASQQGSELLALADYAAWLSLASCCTGTAGLLCLRPAVVAAGCS